MPSNYVAFDVYKRPTPLSNQWVLVPGATVKVRDITNSANLSDLMADGAGHVAGGTLAVAVGTLIRFRYEPGGNDPHGEAYQVTT